MLGGRACGEGRGLWAVGLGGATLPSLRLSARALKAHPFLHSCFREGGGSPRLPLRFPSPAVTPSPRSANIVRMERLTPGKKQRLSRVTHASVPNLPHQGSF